MSEIEAVIFSACRTPVGSPQGTLPSVPAPTLGSIATQEALKHAGDAMIVELLD